jgi:hypothetical protein
MRKGKNAPRTPTRIMAWDIFAQLTEQFPREGRRYTSKDGEPSCTRASWICWRTSGPDRRNMNWLHTNIAG